MSRNSARARSDGDADSLYADINPNACSNSSSYRNLEGGPYGDIPPDPSKQGIYKDRVVFMFEDNECSSESSPYSDNDDKELYTLRNEYLQKLNIVRRRLNLAEVSNDGDKYFNSAFHKKCTITEIIEEDDQDKAVSENHSENPESICTKVQSPVKSTTPVNKNTKEQIGNNLPQSPEKQPKNCKQEKPESKETSSNSFSSVEIETLHPFSICYNRLDAESLSNLLELEYNPPKKKSCFRLQTPKLPSASESNIPYHTKVSLHDGLFKNPTEKTSRKAEPSESQLSRSLIEKFTVTREIQCNESDIDDLNTTLKVSEPKKSIRSTNSSKSFRSESSFFSSPNNCNLFPEVIVKYESPRQVIISSDNSTPTWNDGNRKHNIKTVVNLPNFIEDSPVESNGTVTTNTTILKESTNKKKDFLKKRNLSKLKQEPVDNMWQHLRHLNSKGGQGDVEGVLAEKSKNDKQKKDFVQYISFRREKKRAKTTPIKIKTPVPYGPVILHSYEKSQNVDNSYYFFNSTSSEEEKYVRDLYMGKYDTPRTTADKTVGSRKSWSRFFSCFESLISIFRRNNKN